MKHRIGIALLVALGSLAPLATPARAQEPTLDRVQIALDMTDRKIEQAQALLGATDNVRARTEVNLAVSIQAEAKRVFVATQLGFALRLTLESRGHAERAIAILRGPDPDAVAAQLERTRDLLERARARIEECNQPRARALLRIALEMQARAELAARDGRFLAALQLTVSARERGLRALRLCNLDENIQESADRALQRTDEMLSHARDRVEDHASEEARRALERGFQFQQRARAEFGAGHFEASLRLTQSARSFANRAVRLAGGAP